MREKPVVLYTTSIGVVRNTAERCHRMSKILQTHMVRYEVRDVFMNHGYQEELRKKLGTRKAVVPQLFVGGRHIGNIEIVEQLNEVGKLKQILQPYMRSVEQIKLPCTTCGGYKYVICLYCNGTERCHRVPCSFCVKGTTRCPQCMAGEY